MNYSYQKRSQNRDYLRSSQQKFRASASCDSRDSSRKKYIQVYSKKEKEGQRHKQKQNLRDSIVSLPIKFAQQSQNVQNIQKYHLSKSQANIHAAPSCSAYPSQPLRPNLDNQHTLRSQSLPTKTIIIRQVIKPIPVNFSYFQPNNIKIQVEPCYRASLPINIGWNSNLPCRFTQMKNQMPSKCQILRIQENRNPASSIQMLSCHPVNNFQHNKRNIQKTFFIPPSQCLPNNRVQLEVKNDIYNQASFVPSRSISFSQNTSRFQTPKKNSIQLSNQCYTSFDVQLKDIAVNTECCSIKTSKVQSQSQSQCNSRSQSRIIQKIDVESPQTIKQRQKVKKAEPDYNSLTITKQNQEENFKENLQILKQKSNLNSNREKDNKTSRVQEFLGKMDINLNVNVINLNEKLRNFTQCSDIKINKKQVLKPKKNFIFI